jgi:hypothetical protein
MDILNFISWIKGKRVVTSVDPAKTLIPVGLKDGRRDDEYLAGAITVQDLAAQITPQPTYKVYTALLTQSGGDNPYGVTEINGDLSIGVTYKIEDQGGSGWDFTNVGAPNNNLETYFVATGTTPNSWGIDGALRVNSGAPVVTVLENTIGNIWWTYDSPGNYSIVTNDNLFTPNKTYTNLQLWGDDGASPRVGYIAWGTTNQLIFSLTDVNGVLSNTLGSNANPAVFLTSIEIRVYN